MFLGPRSFGHGRQTRYVSYKDGDKVVRVTDDGHGRCGKGYLYEEGGDKMIAYLGNQWLHGRWRYVNSFDFSAHENAASSAPGPFPSFGTPSQYWDAVESALHSEVEFKRECCTEVSSCFVPALPRGQHHYCCDVIGAVKLLEEAKRKGFDADPAFIDKLQKVHYMHDHFFLYSNCDGVPDGRCTIVTPTMFEQYNV